METTSIIPRFQSQLRIEKIETSNRTCFYNQGGTLDWCCLVIGIRLFIAHPTLGSLQRWVHHGENLWQRVQVFICFEICAERHWKVGCFKCMRSVFHPFWKVRTVHHCSSPSRWKICLNRRQRSCTTKSMANGWPKRRNSTWTMPRQNWCWKETGWFVALVF